MKVLKLKGKNFRNIEEEIFLPCEEMNVISGENAQGKTNILEAIWLFTGAKSFRNNKDNDFIKIGTQNAVLNLDFISKKIENNAKIEISDKKVCFLNEKKIKSSQELAGNFNAVVFSPNDLSIVKEGPSVRRKFLDVAIGQIYPQYIEILKLYLRAIVQRNKIIKEFKYDNTLSIMLDSFEEEIAKQGFKIIEIREKYLKKLKEFLPFVYEGISSGKEKLETEYIYSCEKEILKEKLILKRKEDMYSGTTSIGPHRDDIIFKINNTNARNFGSQGQQRSVALSLKLAEAEVLKKVVGECPVFLLDDVMSELDPTRQEFILNHIKGMQTFITCCEPSSVERLDSGKIFKIRNGKII